MRKVLNKNFFNRETKIVAQELLGKFLVRKIGKKEIAGMIIETEAYDGPHDKASHASKGKTERTEIMFGQPGIFYVYFCYGVHYMLNVVTREKGYPAAVLIRGVENFNGPAPLETARPKGPSGAQARVVFLTGPGKITKFFRIDKKFNGTMAKKSTGLWFEDRGIKVPKYRIKKLPRVGVDYAGSVWSSKKLRFRLEK